MRRIMCACFLAAGDAVTRWWPTRSRNHHDYPACVTRNADQNHSSNCHRCASGILLFLPPLRRYRRQRKFLLLDRQELTISEFCPDSPNYRLEKSIKRISACFTTFPDVQNAASVLLRNYKTVRSSDSKIVQSFKGADIYSIKIRYLTRYSLDFYLFLSSRRNPFGVLQNERVSRLVGTATRGTSSRPWEYARERVLIVDHGYWERLLFFLWSVNAARSALLSHSGHGEQERDRVKEREREKERCNNRPSVPVSAREETAIRSFRASVRLFVWQFHIQENARESWPTQFFIVHPLAHSRTDRISRATLFSSCHPELLCNIASFLSGSLVLAAVRLRRHSSSLNDIDACSLYGKVRRRHLASCHVYRSTITLFTFFLHYEIQLSLNDRCGFRNDAQRK